MEQLILAESTRRQRPPHGIAKIIGASARVYDDGDIETLNLEKEWWEFIKDDLPAEHRQEADHPKPDPSPVTLGYKKGSGKKSESLRKLSINQNVERAEAFSRFLEVEVLGFGNQNMGETSLS